MTHEDAIKIGRAVQMHPYGGKTLEERIAYVLMQAYESGYEDGAKPLVIDDSYMRDTAPVGSDSNTDSNAFK